MFTHKKPFEISFSHVQNPLLTVLLSRVIVVSQNYITVPGIVLAIDLCVLDNEVTKKAAIWASGYLSV